MTKGKGKFRVGQVVYSTRWLCYGLLTKRMGQTFAEGRLWEMTNPRGVVHRKQITVVEREIRALDRREAGRG
jgi:hypothetical protein